jgi:hypothetical protein
MESWMHTTSSTGTHGDKLDDIPKYDSCL